MKILKITSHVIHAIGAWKDEESGNTTLRVYFPRKDAPPSIYEYPNVDPQDIVELVFAPSTGSHWIRSLKNRLPDYTKLDGEAYDAALAELEPSDAKE